MAINLFIISLLSLIIGTSGFLFPQWKYVSRMPSLGVSSGEAFQARPGRQKAPPPPINEYINADRVR
jgi:hypothetical protein